MQIKARGSESEALRVSRVCALGAGQQLAWLRTPKSLLHSRMLRTILEQNHHAWRLISRDPDQSDLGGLESAVPLSTFWLRVACRIWELRYSV